MNLSKDKKKRKKVIEINHHRKLKVNATPSPYLHYSYILHYYSPREGGKWGARPAFLNCSFAPLSRRIIHNANTKLHTYIYDKKYLRISLKTTPAIKWVQKKKLLETKKEKVINPMMTLNVSHSIMLRISLSSYSWYLTFPLYFVNITLKLSTVTYKITVVKKKLLFPHSPFARVKWNLTNPDFF